MKITLTYETQVDVVVDLDKGEVESIQIIKQLGSPMNGVEGFIHVSSDSYPFQHTDTKKALGILKTSPHPKWTRRRNRDETGRLYQVSTRQGWYETLPTMFNRSMGRG